MNDDGYLSADSADTEEELYVAAADAISKEMGSDAPTPPSENQVSTVVKHEVDTDFELWIHSELYWVETIGRDTQDMMWELKQF